MCAQGNSVRLLRETASALLGGAVPKAPTGAGWTEGQACVQAHPLSSPPAAKHAREERAYRLFGREGKDELLKLLELAPAEVLGVWPLRVSGSPTRSVAGVRGRRAGGRRGARQGGGALGPNGLWVFTRSLSLACQPLAAE